MRYLFALLLLAAPAYAQDQPKQSPITVEQRLAIELANKTIQNAQLAVMVEKLQAQINDLQRQLEASRKPAR